MVLIAIAGRPGTDYPVLGKVPYTNFYCDDQSFPGFFADVETRCQAWHYCDIDGRQATFLCPNGTQFSQAVFVCDWWFNVRCELSPKLYAINSRLYGTPTESPTRPHRLITKELLENIFVRRKWRRRTDAILVSKRRDRKKRNEIVVVLEGKYFTCNTGIAKSAARSPVLQKISHESSDTRRKLFSPLINTWVVSPLLTLDGPREALVSSYFSSNAEAIAVT